MPCTVLATGDAVRGEQELLAPVLWSWQSSAGRQVNGQHLSNCDKYKRTQWWGSPEVYLGLKRPYYQERFHQTEWCLRISKNQPNRKGKSLSSRGNRTLQDGSIAGCLLPTELSSEDTLQGAWRETERSPSSQIDTHDQEEATLKTLTNYITLGETISFIQGVTQLINPTVCVRTFSWLPGFESWVCHCVALLLWASLIYKIWL